LFNLVYRILCTSATEVVGPRNEDREVLKCEEELNMGTLWNLVPERHLKPRMGLLWHTVQAAQELDSEKDSEENGQEGEDTGQGIGGLEPKDDMSLVFGTFVYLLPTRRYLVDEMPGLREVLSMQHSSTAAEKAQ
jgi:hypothetical protein